MISLLDDALYAVQDRAPEQPKELVDVAALLAEEIEDRTRTGAMASLSVAPGASEALVLGSPVALRRLFANLVENAVTYGGEARVALSFDNGRIVVHVEDSGPGISEALRQVVMQPFVRLEASRSRKTGGAGLGLAIARRIAEGHGGRMSIGAASPRGARLSVELPLFEPNGGGSAGV
jgi:signal transduction histidine kinase